MREKSLYRGIEYVRLGELPEAERELIKNWLEGDSIIKIKTENELMVDCIQYKEYKQWYKTIYTNAAGLEDNKEKLTDKQRVNPKRSTGLAFD